MGLLSRLGGPPRQRPYLIRYFRHHRDPPSRGAPREILARLIAQHDTSPLLDRERRALSRVFSIIMWDELAAWKIRAQLSDPLVELEPKLAVASEVHDEARHFYVMQAQARARALMLKMSIPEKVSLGLFQLELLASAVFGVDPREILAIGFRNQMEMQTR